MWEKLRERIKYWSQLFLLPMYGFSFLMPRDKHIWVFGSTFGRRFAENPRYLYLYAVQNQKDIIHPVWISHKQEIVDFLQENGYEAYHYHSLRGIWYSLRAGVYLFDNYPKDINFWLSGGAVKVNLWHGVGNKKINYDNKYDKIRHPENLWERWCTWIRRLSDEKPYHYTLATSPVMAEIFSSAFRTDRNHIIEEGYPRNDALFENNFCLAVQMPQEKKAIQRLESYKKENKKIFFYMPTFRESEKKFLQVMDLARYSEFLENNGYIFVTKLHPKSKLQEQFRQFRYSNILNIEADVDAYLLLKYADVLVTDYSSVYSDYMLLNRPVIGFYYDYEEYSTHTREGYFDFEEYMPEIKVRTMDQLQEAMRRVIVEDNCMTKRICARKKMFTNCDGNASERLTDKIMKIIGLEQKM